MELRGIEYLRKKLNLYQSRVNLRYKYYAMQHYRAPIGITIPAHVRAKYRATLGWTAKGVDCLADRLVFREFTNDDFNVTEIFDRNNPDILFDSAILAALIGSCCFIYISKGEDDEVRLQVIEASKATGVIDPIQVIHRPDAVRPFGRSRITRSGMYYQKEAEQTFERANITAEFYSWPQKYIIGLDPDAEQLETYKATVSSLLTISASDGGEKPSIGQFTTASMSPFTEQLRTAAAGFAGEMGLTLDDMGFVSDNPSSVEAVCDLLSMVHAITARRYSVRVAGGTAEIDPSAGLLNVAYVAACLRDEFHYARSQFVRTTVKWEPLFEADANTMTMIGDGVVKLNQALPGYINAETIRDLTGIAGDMSAKPAISEVVTDGT